MVQSGRHHDGDYYCSDVRGLGWARASRLFWVGTLKDVLMLEGLFSEFGQFVGLGAIKCVVKEFGFDWSALTYSVMALPKSPSLTKISPDYGASHLHKNAIAIAYWWDLNCHVRIAAESFAVLHLAWASPG